MEIPDIKSRLNIIEVAGHLHIEVNKNNKALCPFHNDKKPSLQFSKEKQICTCFSSNCNAGTMDIIGLTEKKLQLNTHEALKYLAKLAGEQNGNGTASHPPQEPENKSSLPAEAQRRHAVLKKVFSIFENSFLNSTPAKEYARDKRGLDIRKITIGYNTGTFHHGENKHLIESCLKYGLLQPKNNSGGYPAFGKGCIVFPLKNKENHITGLYFRKVEPAPKKAQHLKQPDHLYLKDREGLYPHYPKAEAKTIILTESIIDAVTLLQHPEITNQYEILSCYGTEGVKEQYAAIRELKHLEEVIYFFDGDQPGIAGVLERGKELLEILPNIKITVVNTPEHEDIGSLMEGHQPEILTHLLEERVNFFSSNEKEPLPDRQAGSTEIKKKVPRQLPDNETPTFNTSNPYALKYKTPTAYYQILGGLRKELDSMRVTLMIENKETRKKSRNKLDLYEDKQVEKISREAAEKLDLRADLIESDIGSLTDLLENHRNKQLSVKQEEETQHHINPEENKKCLDFLNKPKLIQNISKLIGKAGVTGEENNRIFLFGIASSYKMPESLHALIQGSSGSGKTHLLIKISDFIPPEDCIILTRVTENSFYNYGENDLSHKLICLEDLDGMKEEAFLAFRELQSRGILSSSTSGKDEKGQIRAFVKTVRGPIASLSATTKGEIYEDNMSRSFLIAVDETDDQTQRIIEYQNRKAAGLTDERKEKQITEFIRNCIRLLKPYRVINPYANKVKLPPQAHKIRRLNELYQAYVKQITLLNQYQRKQDNQGRIISDKEDLQAACNIMFNSIILKIDELDGSLRQFYERLKEYIKDKGDKYENYQFTQREVRQGLKYSKSQMHRYITDLLELEYLQQSGGYANKGFKYKIVYWDDIQALRKRIKQYLKDQLDKL